MNKYHNVKTEIDGHTFDSKHEAGRYCELIVLRDAGMISGLILQPSFDISINGHRICKYIADFEYFTHDSSRRIIEDAKSEATRRIPIYRLKKKLMKAVYDIDIVEV